MAADVHYIWSWFACDFLSLSVEACKLDSRTQNRVQQRPKQPCCSACTSKTYQNHDLASFQMVIHSSGIAMHIHSGQQMQIAHKTGNICSLFPCLSAMPAIVHMQNACLQVDASHNLQLYLTKQDSIGLGLALAGRAQCTVWVRWPPCSRTPAP